MISGGGKSAKRAAFKTCKPVDMETTTWISFLKRKREKKSLEALCILKL